MSFSIIVATDPLFGIAQEGKIPWKSKEDMAYFREQTSFHETNEPEPAVIMGRLTYDSIGKPLSRRLNIVLTRHPEKYENKDNLIYLKGLENALDHCVSERRRIWVIGGAQIYREAVHHPKCEKIHMTLISGLYECDRFFHYLPDKYKLIDTQELSFDARVSIYERRNKAEYHYLKMLEEVATFGINRPDRTGVGTKSIFGCQYRFDLADGFPLLTTKKMFLRGIFEELMWILRGETDSQLLEAKKVNIWKGNTEREFLDKRGLDHYKEGLIGPTYGWAMRSQGAPYDHLTGEATFPGNHSGFDQLKYVIDLIVNEPESRRILIDLWDPPRIKEMAITPCMMVYQFYCDTVNKELNLHMFIRSSDIFLGLPWNIAYAALFLHLICQVKEIKQKHHFKPGQLLITTTDQHLYLNHLEQAREQLKRTPYTLPVLEVKREVDDITEFEFSDIKLKYYESHPSIKAEMAV